MRFWCQIRVNHHQMILLIFHNYNILFNPSLNTNWTRTVWELFSLALGDVITVSDKPWKMLQASEIILITNLPCARFPLRHNNVMRGARTKSHAYTYFYLLNEQIPRKVLCGSARTVTSRTSLSLSEQLFLYIIAKFVVLLSGYFFRHLTRRAHYL